MADPFFFQRDESGVTASHPAQAVFPVLVAPVPDEQQSKNFNAIRDPLVILGCKELPNDHFEFDSSFVTPNAAKGFTRFKELLDLHVEGDRLPPSAVFGHADPTGKPGYNRMLSGRRATAVYGVLTKDTAIWENLFSNHYGGDEWNPIAIQNMLSISLITLADIGLPEAPFYQDAVDGGKTEQTRQSTAEAIAAYRLARGMGKGTTLGAKERKQLFKEYMDAICNGDKFKLAKTDFIARGQGGAALTGDAMGCGEFNPRFLLTDGAVKAAEKDKSLQPARDESYAVNRRVIIYLFKHGTEVEPSKWPCPAPLGEDVGACQKRFWSNGVKRQKEADEERTFGEDMTHLSADDQGELVETPIEETGNTMACRFYHGFARHSPCEAKLKEWVIRFKVPTFGGKLATLKNRRFFAKVGESESSPEIRGTTDDFGVVRLPVLSEQTLMTIKLDAASALADDDAPATDPTDESRFLTVTVDGGTLENRDTTNNLAIKQRLYNMGYGETPPKGWSDREFQRALQSFSNRNGLLQASDADVRERIVTVHDLSVVPSDDEDQPTPLPPGA
jgi:hypothetical protein